MISSPGSRQRSTRSWDGRRDRAQPIVTGVEMFPLANLLAASRPGSDGAGYLAFAIVAALFVAGWFLYRSLRHHLGKIDFDERPVDDRSGAERHPPGEIRPTREKDS